MRRLVPYLGLALAIAVGVAIGIGMAPHVWWIVAIAAAVAIIRGAWNLRRWLADALGFVILALLIAWPIWLWRRGQPSEAIFTCLLLAVWIGWRWVTDRTSALWKWFLAQGVEPK